MSWSSGRPCDRCGSLDNLKQNTLNGDEYCFTPNCVSNKERQSKFKGESSQISYNVDKIEGSFSAIPIRRISQRTCEFFNYQVGLHNGESVQIANYPSCQKIRTKDKRFYIVGDGSKLTLFGKEKWNKGKSIIITEGEIDCLSIAEAQDCKWPVVSLPNGAQSAKKIIQQELDWLLGFESIILCFDNDEPGKLAVNNVCDLFPPGRLKIASLSEKDANDCLVAGKWDELAKIVFNAQEYRPDGIICGAELTVEELYRQEPKGIDLPYPALNEMIRGAKDSRIYTVYAGCVDAETEYLTPSGWKKISEYSEEELVGQYTEGGLEFVYPEKYWKRPAEKFYHLKTTRGVDMLLSPEHTVVYRYKGKCSLQTITMEQLFQVNKEKPNGFQGKFLTTFDYSGSGIDFNEGELRLQVAVNADGRIVEGGANNYTQMRFNKYRKYMRLISLCEKFDLDFDNRGINSQGQYEVIVYPKSNIKRFDAKFYSATKEQLSIIFDEMRYWDGSTKRGLRYFSKYKTDADFIQFCGAVNGFRGNIYLDNKNCYEVKFTNRTMVGIGSRHSKNITEIYPVNKFKYCFTMPNKTWIARRNGNIFVTHNTGNGKSTFLKEISYFMSKNDPELKVANIFLEESQKFTALSYVAIDNNIPTYKILENIKLIPDEKKATSLDVLRNQYFYRHFGSLDSKRLLNMLEYLVVGKGVKVVILDHISILISGLEGTGDSERQLLDQIMTKLRSFTERTGAILFVATQLKRKKGSYGEGEHITESDARGSGGIEHLSDFIISLNRNKDSDTPNDCQLSVIKNRLTGLVGNADLLHYDNETGRLLNKKVAEAGTNSLPSLLTDDNDGVPF